GSVLEWAQQHAGPGMEARPAGEVGMAHDEIDDRADLRLGGWIGPCALLLELLAPASREVAIEVESLARALDLQRVSVVAVVMAFGQHVVIRAPGLGRLAAHHQARLLRM